VHQFSDYGSDWPQLLRYVLVPFLLAAGLIYVAFWARHHIALQVGINVCAVLVALFAFEAVQTSRVLRSFANTVQASLSDIAREQGLRDALPPTATVKRLNGRIKQLPLKDAMLSNTPYAKVLLCAQADGLVTYKADRYGFNNPDGVHDHGPARIALIGDSFVEGFCLPPGTDLTSRVRDVFPATVSLGHRGNGPLIELAVLGRFGPLIRPKLTFLVYFDGNDWENLISEMREDWLREALEPEADFGRPEVTAARTAARRDLIESVWDEQTAMDFVIRKGAIRNFLALSQTATQLGLHYPRVPRQQPVFKRILERMKVVTSTWGGQLALVFIPRVNRFRGIVPNGFVFDQGRRLVLYAADEVGIPVIDLTEKIAEAPTPIALYAPDGHFNEDGARFAARHITDFAAKQFASSARSVD
jgi:hypothetical protein